MGWIDDLSEYYAHNNVPAIRVKMLYKRFSSELPSIMARAVESYIDENEHFPTVASFKPYVKEAQHISGNRADMFTDDDIYQWEVNRGSMREWSEIEAEMTEARSQL
jgi:hypothetical protein